MNRITRGLILGLGSALAFVGVQAVPATAAEAACASLDDAIYSVSNPNTKQQLLTPWAGEASNAANYGFTQNDGVVFKASNVAASGLVPVFQLKKTNPADYLYTTSACERDGAAANYGFTYERIAFYVSAVELSCTDPVVRYTNGTQHNLAQTDTDKARYSTWVSEGTRFHAAAPGGVVTPPPPTEEPVNPIFSFGVIPDTQNEVLSATDTRLADRNRWLLDQGSKFVTQTGDLNNWDTPAHEQFVRSKAAMDVLENADVPYTVAIGNHDTAAVGPGGDDNPDNDAWVGVRNTTTFNTYFKAADFQQVAGAYETGKVDNVFTKYTAGGKKWMVVTLEFCARQGAVEWARAAIAANPDYNVVISTHYFLTGGAVPAIATDRQGYGSTTPSYVWDQLKGYPNVKMIFSGHTGYAAKSVLLPTPNGNKVRAFLGTFHENSTNPVRLLTVDTANDTVTTKVYGPNTGKTWTEYGESITDLDII